MKLVLISDTHGGHSFITMPEGDTLIIAGDFCSYGHSKEAHRFLYWLEAQKQYKYKILVAGNHDICFQDKANRKKMLRLAPSVSYLEDSSITIEGIKFWGSPYTPKFFNWAFMAGQDLLAKKWAKIPVDANVVITHGPPADILDLAPSGHHCGCPILLERIIEIRPQLHIFGHIHQGYGCNYHSVEGTTFLNVSTCTERYEPINPAVEWEVKPL